MQPPPPSFRARIRFLPASLPITLATGLAASSLKALPQSAFFVTSAFFTSPPDGTKNLATKDFITLHLPASASARVRSSSFYFSSVAARFHPCPSFWLVVQLSWPSLASSFFASLLRGSASWA